MICTKRFEKLADKYGMKIKKCVNLWFDYDTGKLKHFKHRHDIMSVQFRNHHLMTIPKKMYSFPKVGYRPVNNRDAFRSYFEYEHHLKEWDITLKRTDYINTIMNVK